MLFAVAFEALCGQSLPPTPDPGLCRILRHMRLPQDPRPLHLLFLPPSTPLNLNQLLPTYLSVSA